MCAYCLFQNLNGGLYLISAEIGDYDETLDREHLKATVYLPSQEQVLEKILAFHRRHM